MSYELFQLKINMGNDAMQHPDDVANSLESIAKDLRNGVGGGRIRDLNGNSVGDFDFTSS